MALVNMDADRLGEARTILFACTNTFNQCDWDDRDDLEDQRLAHTSLTVHEANATHHAIDKGVLIGMSVVHPSIKVLGFPPTVKIAIETTRITNGSEERSLYSHGCLCVSSILQSPRGKRRRGEGKLGVGRRDGLAGD